MLKAIPKGMSPSPFLEEEYYVAHNGTAFARMNLFPTTHNGHLLFIPHDIDKQTPFQMDRQELLDTAKLMKQAIGVLKNSLPPDKRPEGYTIGWNIGLAGGQSIAHSHAHIFGRKKNDNVGAEKPTRGGIVNVLPTNDAFYKSAHALEELSRDKILMENELAIAIPSPHPIIENHVLVLPKREIKSYHDLTAEEIAAMIMLSKKWLQEKHGLDIENPGGDKGANIGWNVGETAGQTYNDSSALEVIPRVLGDVEKARGGIAKIIPPADAAYYRGEKTGVKRGADGGFVTGDLEQERVEHYALLVNKMRFVWPRRPGLQL